MKIPNNRKLEINQETLEQLKTVSTATLTTQLLKHGFNNVFMQGVLPLRPDIRMAGYAFTLRYVPSREDVVDTTYNNDTNIQRLAVEAVNKDDVLVIDARGDKSRAASFGHILATRISQRGAVGLVTDGALRDTPSFKKLDLAAYCQGAHPTTSYVLHHPVDINVPVACGGVLVMPGDIIVGDGEGVVVLPAQVAEEVAHAAYEQERLEEFILHKVERGESIKGVYPPDDKTLAEYEQWKLNQ